MDDLKRWRMRDGLITFDGRNYAREIEGLPTVFAMEARADLEPGQLKAREAALIEAAEIVGLDIPENR
jgi:hypothetical protein